MRRRIVSGIVVVFLALACDSAPADLYPRAGWKAELATYAHDVSGTITIVDADTFRADPFTYDGDGPAVYFYLAESVDRGDLLNGLRVGPQLNGTPYNNASLTVDLSSGTLDGYNAISVWCEDFDVDFGSGGFMPDDPTPGDANHDGLVDDLDLTALATRWQQSGGLAEGDFTGDGFVDDLDLTVLATAWPAGGLGLSAVPEPATLSLLVLGALAVLRRPHR